MAKKKTSSGSKNKLTVSNEDALQKLLKKSCIPYETVGENCSFGERGAAISLALQAETLKQLIELNEKLESVIRRH